MSYQEIQFDGEVIDEPGVYSGVPMDVYHSDCCSLPSVSSSFMREMAPPDGCPMKAWDRHYLNPDRVVDDEPKVHFNLGRAIHTLMLGETDFRKLYAVRPAEFKDWRTNASKEWRENMTELGMTVLVPEDRENLEGMANRIANDRVFLDHLRGPVERTIVRFDKASDLFVKARPDVIPDDQVVADLKSTADAGARACQTSILKFGYHQQLAAISTNLESITGKRVTDHVLLFIEAKRPWAYNIKPVDAEFIYIGMRQNRAALSLIRQGLDTGYWPTYFSSGQTASPSEYFVKSIDGEPAIPSRP